MLLWPWSHPLSFIHSFIHSFFHSFIYSLFLSFFAAIPEQLPEARDRRFTLQTPIAREEKLFTVAGSSIAEQNLSNSKVLMEWED